MTVPPAPRRWAAASLAVLLLAPATATATAATQSAAATPAPAGGLIAPSSLAGGAAPGPAQNQGPAQTLGPAAPSGPNTLQPPTGGARIGSVALVHGQLTASAAGRPVVLELLDPVHGWVALGATRADSTGSFVVAWRPKRLGRFTLRGRLAGAGGGPTAAIEVYRSVVATYFGPGTYGSRTACGQIMTPQLVGVAHRTLPCGTMVDIAYGTETISVPVIDRGPYASGVSYDLTTATAASLGVSDTVHIGAVALHGDAPIGS